METSVPTGVPKLSRTWITDRQIDLEYKSYLILAYLKKASEFFESEKLYPVLSDLIEHYRELLVLKENAGSCESRTAAVVGIDWEKLRLVYEKNIPENLLLEEIMKVVEFALPHFSSSILEGRGHYEEAEKIIALEGVGVIPLRQDEGYVILEDQESAKNRVYEYHVTLYERPGERFKAVHTSYVRDYPVGLNYHFRNIKQELIRLRNDLPNPAVFGAVSARPLPFEETFLPLVRRMLAALITPSPVS